jgi:hypothetical protein
MTINIEPYMTHLSSCTLHIISQSLQPPYAALRIRVPVLDQPGQPYDDVRETPPQHSRDVTDGHESEDGWDGRDKGRDAIVEGHEACEVG